MQGLREKMGGGKEKGKERGSEGGIEGVVLRAEGQKAYIVLSET